MRLKTKLILLGIISLGFIAYISWYTFHYMKLRTQSVVSLTAREFNCPPEKIEMGPSYQFNEGPTEIPVTGCGQKGRVFCDDDTQKHGMFGQYFAFDLSCRLARQ